MPVRFRRGAVCAHLNGHQIGRRKTAAQCSLNHLDVVLQFTLEYYFLEVIEMIRGKISETILQIVVCFTVGMVGGLISFGLTYSSAEAFEIFISFISALGTVSVSYIALKKERKKPDLSFFISVTNKDIYQGYDVFALNKGSSTVVSVEDYYEKYYDVGRILPGPYEDDPEPTKLVVCQEYELTTIYHFNNILEKPSDEENDIHTNSTDEARIEWILSRKGLFHEQVNVSDQTTDKKWELSISWDNMTEVGIPYLQVRTI